LEHWIATFSNNYGALVCLFIIAWTFLEGETAVVATGALICGGVVHLHVWTLALCAFAGSSAADQTWFYVGRIFGAPMLARRPAMRAKMNWVLHLLTRHQNLFILAFRFIYGMRVVSPFIIGMTGVSRGKFLVLNLLAAATWASLFAVCGYTLGKAAKAYLGTSSMILVAVGAAVLCGIIALALRKRVRAEPTDESFAPTPPVDHVAPYP
jgi:membrane protein DedA with SNARE-associated domain